MGQTASRAKTSKPEDVVNNLLYALSTRYEWEQRSIWYKSQLVLAAEKKEDEGGAEGERGYETAPPPAEEGRLTEAAAAATREAAAAGASATEMGAEAEAEAEAGKEKDEGEPETTTAAAAAEEEEAALVSKIFEGKHEERGEHIQLCPKAIHLTEQYLRIEGMLECLLSKAQRSYQLKQRESVLHREAKKMKNKHPLKSYALNKHACNTHQLLLKTLIAFDNQREACEWMMKDFNLKLRWQSLENKIEDEATYAGMSPEERSKKEKELKEKLACLEKEKEDIHTQSLMVAFGYLDIDHTNQLESDEITLPSKLFNVLDRDNSHSISKDNLLECMKALYSDIAELEERCCHDQKHSAKTQARVNDLESRVKKEKEALSKAADKSSMKTHESNVKKLEMELQEAMTADLEAEEIELKNQNCLKEKKETLEHISREFNKALEENVLSKTKQFANDEEVRCQFEEMLNRAEDDVAALREGLKRALPSASEVVGEQALHRGAKRETEKEKEALSTTRARPSEAAATAAVEASG